MTSDVLIKPATAGRWDDVDKVFGRKGDPSWCWCQFHCSGDQHRGRAEENRDALQQQLRSRPARGLLAYDDGEPVGWVRLGRVIDFERIIRNQRRSSVVGDDQEQLWVITCFVVPPRYRRRGVATALVGGAIDFARRHDAATLEAHPVDTRGERKPGDSLYHGVLSTFLDAGFSEVGRTGPNRPIVRLDLRRPRP